jgi:hypothetical protein
MAEFEPAILTEHGCTSCEDLAKECDIKMPWATMSPRGQHNRTPAALNRDVDDSPPLREPQLRRKIFCATSLTEDGNELSVN